MAEEGSKSEEIALIEELQSRDPVAWTTLYNEHYPALFRYFRVRTADIVVAEDLAAQVFVEAIKGMGSYRYRGKPMLAWLYRIARNLASDHFKSARRKQVQPLSTVRELEMTGASSQSVDPGGQMHLLDLRNALLRLKNAHREVLILHYYVGLSLPKVAVMLGKRERAVYSLHARAIEALRKMV